MNSNKSRMTFNIREGVTVPFESVATTSDGALLIITMGGHVGDRLLQFINVSLICCFNSELLTSSRDWLRFWLVPASFSWATWSWCLRSVTSPLSSSQASSEHWVRSFWFSTCSSCSSRRTLSSYMHSTLVVFITTPSPYLVCNTSSVFVFSFSLSPDKPPNVTAEVKCLSKKQQTWGNTSLNIMCTTQL